MKLHTRRPWWRRMTGRGYPVVPALLLAVAVVPVAAAPAEAAGGSSAALGPQGFPRWYEDAAGQRLDLCLDNLRCLSASVNLTPFAGGEADYWSATAELPSSLLDHKPGRLDLAVSAGFDPTTGVRVTFARIRIRLRNLTPNASYTVTHPYGVETLLTDGNGDARPPGDVGCVPPEVHEPLPGEPPPPPPPGVAVCHFTSALSSKVFDGFLRWDSGAPQGFLGDGITPHAVTGSPTGNNFFEVVGPGVNSRTTLFTVEGRLAAPVAADPVSRAFGDQKVGTVSTARTVTVTNTSGRALTLAAPALTATEPGQFSLLPAAGVTCADGVPLPDGATCRLRVAFNPTTPGFKRATLTLPNTGDNGNLVASVALNGTGAEPMLSVRGKMPIGDVGVGRRTTVPLTVTSSGDVDLVVSEVRRTGSAEFGLDATACTRAPVKARRSCAVRITYRPRGVGTDRATLSIVHDGARSPSRVTLTGRGVDVSAPVVTRLTVRPRRFDRNARPATVRFAVDGSALAAVRVSKGRQVVRRLGTARFAKAGSATMRWDGRANNHSLVAPGHYTVTVVARDRAGNTSSRSAPVVVAR